MILQVSMRWRINEIGLMLLSKPTSHLFLILGHTVCRLKLNLPKGSPCGLMTLYAGRLIWKQRILKELSHSVRKRDIECLLLASVFLLDFIKPKK